MSIDRSLIYQFESKKGYDSFEIEAIPILSAVQGVLCGVFLMGVSFVCVYVRNYNYLILLLPALISLFALLDLINQKKIGVGLYMPVSMATFGAWVIVVEVIIVLWVLGFAADSIIYSESLQSDLISELAEDHGFVGIYFALTICLQIMYGIQLVVFFIFRGRRRKIIALLCVILSVSIVLLFLMKPGNLGLFSRMSAAVFK